MIKKFLLTGLVTTVVNLLLHTVAYIFILKDFYQSHPAISEECREQLYRPADQLIIWAMAVTSVTMGFLITTIIQWSGARTFASGLKYGLLIAILYWGSVNFGLYASSNLFSQASVLVDFVCSSTVMTIACAVAAWMLGKRKAN